MGWFRLGLRTFGDPCYTMLLAIFAEVTAGSRAVPCVTSLLHHDRCRLVHVEPMLAIVAVDIRMTVQIACDVNIATVELCQRHRATGPISKLARGFVCCLALSSFFCFIFIHFS